MNHSRRRVSAVWAYFEKLSRDRVRCRLCRHEQNYQGTTGNIIRHLKSKHNIDTTPNSQIETLDTQGKVAMIEIIHENSVIDSRLPTNEYSVELMEENVPTEVLPRETRNARSKVVSYCEETEIDPYIETDVPLGEYLISDADKKSKVERNAGQSNENKRKHNMEEERILAEIEYFREKAEYYRMQKNLVALQAKKIKCELDRMEQV